MAGAARALAAPEAHKRRFQTNPSGRDKLRQPAQKQYGAARIFAMRSIMSTDAIFNILAFLIAVVLPIGLMIVAFAL